MISGMSTIQKHALQRIDKLAHRSIIRRISGVWEGTGMLEGSVNLGDEQNAMRWLQDRTVNALIRRGLLEDKRTADGRRMATITPAGRSYALRQRLGPSP